MSEAAVTSIDISEPSSRLAFTIGTIVNDGAEYERMRESFVRGGFGSHDCEFLFLDNRKENRFDAYAGLRAILSRARGRYVLLCHQDLRLLNEGRIELEKCLQELDRLDENWALAGNAGGTDTGVVLRISDPHGDDQRIGTFPALVHSLDENFIVVRRSAMIAPSHDLCGFHLYGTDLCLQAATRGMSAYVIDFHLQHLGRGTIGPEYYQCLEALEAKYAGLFQPRRIRTTCLHPFLTGSHVRLTVERLKRFRKKMRKLSRVAEKRAS